MKEAFLWLSTVSLAKEGDEEMKEMLRAENALRREKGLPTVEEELLAMASQEQRK